MKRTIQFARLYWREIIIVIMFLYLNTGISDAKQFAEKAYYSARDATTAVSNVQTACEDAQSAAENAKSSAEDTASQCIQ